MRVNHSYGCSLCLQAVISALYYNKVEYQHCHNFKGRNICITQKVLGSIPLVATPWSPKDTLIKVSDNSSKVYIQEWLERSPDH